MIELLALTACLLSLQPQSGREANLPAQFVIAYLDDLTADQKKLLSTSASQNGMNGHALLQKAKRAGYDGVSDSRGVYLWPEDLFGLARSTAARAALDILAEAAKSGPVLNLSQLPKPAKDFVDRFLRTQPYSDRYSQGAPPELAFKLDSSVSIKLRSGNQTIDAGSLHSKPNRPPDSFYNSAFPVPRDGEKPNVGGYDPGKRISMPIRFAFSGDLLNMIDRMKMIHDESEILEKRIAEASERFRDASRALAKVLTGKDLPEKGSSFSDLDSADRAAIRDFLEHNMGELGFSSADQVDAFLRTATIDSANPSIFLTLGDRRADGTRSEHSMQISSGIRP